MSVEIPGNQGKNGIEKLVESNRAFEENIRDMLGAEACLWMDEEPTKEEIEAAVAAKTEDSEQERYDRFTDAHEVATEGFQRIINSREFAYLSGTACTMGDKKPEEKAFLEQSDTLYELKEGFKLEAAYNIPGEDETQS